MVKFYCDRCLNEVEGPEALVEITVEFKERPNVTLWSWGGEVCRACSESLKEAALTHLAFSTAEEGKKRSLRKVVS